MPARRRCCFCRPFSRIPCLTHPTPAFPLPLSAFSPGPSLAVSVTYRHRLRQCVPRGTVCTHSIFTLESCISNTPQAKSISNPRLKLCVPFSVHGPPPSFREDQAPGALPSFPRGQTGNQTRRTPSSQDLPSPHTPRLLSPVLQRPPHSPTAATVTSPKYSCGYVTDLLNSLLDSLKATSLVQLPLPLEAFRGPVPVGSLPAHPISPQHLDPASYNPDLYSVLRFLLQTVSYLRARTLPAQTTSQQISAE